MMSVIIPVRNEERNIGEMLQNLKKDGFKGRHEIIVVDGDSKDKTVKIAKGFGAKVVKQKKLGISNARNLGWQKAAGDVLVYLEADHIVKSGFLQAVAKYFEQNKDIDAARYNITAYEGNYIQKALAVQVKLSERRYHGARDFCTIFRKYVLEKTGGWDENIGFAEDRELPARVKDAGFKIGFIENAKVEGKPVDSFELLFKEGRWYGRNIFSYVRKTKDYITLAGVMLYASFVPLFVLSAFSRIFTLLLFLAFLILFGYSLKGFIITKSLYAFLMIPVNIVRGFGELVGILERPFVKHMGKIS